MAHALIIGDVSRLGFLFFPELESPVLEADRVGTSESTVYSCWVAPS